MSKLRWMCALALGCAPAFVIGCLEEPLDSEDVDDDIETIESPDAVQQESCGGLTCVEPNESCCAVEAPLGTYLTCVDTQTDENHCGGCGIECTGTQHCDANECDATNPDAKCCPLGTRNCGGTCLSVVIQCNCPP
ncbi:MAG: hypothetical protein HOW73_21535 [Polyangiaceae bacterium]|nr:hypothetical protein [Polyangiaceae bacterium]